MPEFSPEEEVREYLGTMKGVAIYNEMANRFKKSFGAINCIDLIRPWANDPVSLDCFRNCEKIVVETAGLTMELILEARENGTSFEMGENMYSRLFPSLDKEAP
jgi:hypothetical protein